MKKTKAALYRGSLKLDKITGIRNDLNQRKTYIPVKKEWVFPTPKKAMKTAPNVTPDGKYKKA